MAIKTIKVDTPGTKIEYRNGASSQDDTEGIIFQIDITITEHGTDIIYHVRNEDEGEDHAVDGKTYQAL